MKKHNQIVEASSPTATPSSANGLVAQWQRVVQRRSFLKGLGAVSAAVTTGGLLVSDGQAKTTRSRTGKLPPGDVAILRFLAAAELIESDLWSQYNELGGVVGFNGGNPAYRLALQNLDSDMPQYIADNTDDELSHASFLNAYLISKGAQPVDLDAFRTLPSSQATGAQQIGRITNLLELNVDTSWYTRYRSGQNPDLGAQFTSPLDLTGEPAIPLNDKDTPPHQPQPVPPKTKPERRMQAIANTAGFHFAMIEQGGSSLYSCMALKATDVEVLRIVVSIGGVEVDHFSLWHDKAGNAISQPLAGVTDPETGITFPDFNKPKGDELRQTNLILPEPCSFLSGNLPVCSIIRPTSTPNAGAEAAIEGLTADLLFQGQSNEFFDTVLKLAVAADSAQRGF